MFTFLKNRFVSSTIAFATFGEERAAGSRQQQQQQKHPFSTTANSSTAPDYPQNHYHSSSTPNYPYHSTIAGQNLMDEAYFLRKFEEYEKNDTWDYVFQRINVESETQAKKLSLCCDLSNSFHEKNRYRNVLPYDQNRITLKCIANESGSYINASPLHLPFARRNYILTQGPLPNTASDFWQMVFEQKVSICIMLSKVMEKSFIKCHSYFPCKEENTLRFEHFTCELEHEEVKPNYIIRRIRLTPSESFQRIGQVAATAGTTVESNESAKRQPSTPRTIHHFQFTTWPDFGVPEHTDHFLEFLEEVRNAREKLEQEEDSKAGSNNPPIVCHCSAGIGRTGTFVIVDSVVSMIEKKRAALQQQRREASSSPTSAPSTAPKLVNNNNGTNTDAVDKKVEEQLDSLEALVIFIRKHRMGLIQTSQQLRFCWKTIVDWIQKSSANNDAKNNGNKGEDIKKAAALDNTTSNSRPASKEQPQQPTTVPSSSTSAIGATLTDIRWLSTSPSPEPQQPVSSPHSPNNAGTGASSPPPINAVPSGSPGPPRSPATAPSPPPLMLLTSQQQQPSPPSAANGCGLPQPH